MVRKRWAVLIVLFTAAVLVSPQVFAAPPTGAGPDDPLYTTGTWQSLTPNASVWFYFDYPGDKSKVEVDLDANGVGQVGFSIYTPALATAWKQDPTTKPVGIGTPPGTNSASASHDLVWLGGFNAGGRYFVRVTNNNPAPITFRLFISGTNITTLPTPSPTPTFFLPNPLATPVPTGNIPGRLLFMDGSGGVAYTVNGDGTNLQAGPTGVLDPSWSPDGKKIAFSRWAEPAGLFVSNVDGSDEQMVFRGEQILSPEWSPDGSLIVFTRKAGGGGQDRSICFHGSCFTLLADQHWKLGVWNLGTNALTEPKCSNHCFSPTWSPDGRTIAYADAEFGILKTDLTNDPEYNVFTDNPDVMSPSYSPDGSKIVFMVKQSDHWEINVMNSDGSNVIPVTFADPLSFTPVNNVAPTWSPDGKKILFLSDRPGKWQFYVVNVDGTGLLQVLKSVTDRMIIYYNFSNERMVEWRP